MYHLTISEKISSKYLKKKVQIPLFDVYWTLGFAYLRRKPSYCIPCALKPINRHQNHVSITYIKRVMDVSKFVDTARRPYWIFAFF